MIDDIQFLSGEFFDLELPREQRWMANYYRTPVQLQFLRYYLVFGTVERFKDVTGINVDYKYLRRLEAMYHILLDMRERAKHHFDVEGLWEVETGRKKKKKLR